MAARRRWTLPTATHELIGCPLETGDRLETDLVEGSRHLYLVVSVAGGRATVERCPDHTTTKGAGRGTHAQQDREGL